MAKWEIEAIAMWHGYFALRPPHDAEMVLLLFTYLAPAQLAQKDFSPLCMCNGNVGR